MIRSSIVFRVASAAAIVAATFHGLSMLFPAVSRLEYEPDYPSWRHVLFIGINLAVAWLFQVRPRWFVWAYGALTVQVLTSHGWGAIRIWLTERRVDWISVAVSIGAPLLLLALIVERRSARSAPRCVQ